MLVAEIDGVVAGVAACTELAGGRSRLIGLAVRAITGAGRREGAPHAVEERARWGCDRATHATRDPLYAALGEDRSPRQARYVREL